MAAAAIDREGFYITTKGERSHFHKREFKCRCGRCAFTDVSAKLIDNLEALRLTLGVPLTVTSGIRCPEHNQRVGGARFSKHMPDGNGVGHAADVTTAFRTPVELYLWWRCVEIGGGCGLYSRWLHVDDRDDRTEWVERGEASTQAIGDFISHATMRELV